MIALVGACAAVAGGIVTGMFSYLIVKKRRKNDQTSRSLICAYNDICSFCRLEELYTQALVTEGRSALAIKRGTRARLREEMRYDSPSEQATILHCERRVKDLSRFKDDNS